MWDGPGALLPANLFQARRPGGRPDGYRHIYIKKYATAEPGRGWTGCMRQLVRDIEGLRRAVAVGRPGISSTDICAMAQVVPQLSVPWHTSHTGKAKPPGGPGRSKSLELGKIQIEYKGELKKDKGMWYDATILRETTSLQSFRKIKH